jgi:serine/threonine protein kinase
MFVSSIIKHPAHSGGSRLGDINDFLASYDDALTKATGGLTLPTWLVEQYSFVSCLKQKDDKQVFLLERIADHLRVILRVTTVGGGEDAQAEGRILSRLDHPAIPKAYYIWEVNGKAYLLREYVAGRSLDEAVANGPLAVHDIMRVAQRFSEVLTHLHSQIPPVIHRDIKPQNIVLAPDGSLKLIDFGIARTFKPGSDSDTVFAGTLSYAAPEQFGYAQSTRLTDIYAFGILLLFLATGSTDRQNISERIKDKGLRRLIEHCIAFNPSDRFQNAEAISRYIKREKTRKLKTIVRSVGLGIGALAVIALVSVFVIVPYLDTARSAGNTFDSVGNEIDTAVESGGPPHDASFAPYGTARPITQDDIGFLNNNIINGGFAVQGTDELYFAKYEGIYAMDLDGKNIRQLSSVYSARNLCFFDNQLYFSTNGGIYRLDPETTTITNLSKDSVNWIYFSDGSLYYENLLDDRRLYRLDLADLSSTLIDDRPLINDRNIVGTKQYYISPSEPSNLYSSDLDGSNETLLDEGQFSWISIFNGEVYFSDFEGWGYFRHASLDGSISTALWREAPSYTIVTESGVYFIDGNDDILFSSMDEKTRFTILQGRCSAFNLTEKWIFYLNVDDDFDLWMVRLDGTENHRIEVE